ncbi:MAG TPA: nitrate transporter, partial [Marinobacter sp.]|nr:nitrate transporter [Marinobacter sp.]
MVHPTPLRQRASFRVRLGFVPLLDSAPLIMARELGLFDAEGLEVELSREGSWASMRDKIAFGLLDGGQMLAPMPLNMSLAADGPHTPIISAMVLSRNGNGITLSRDLYQQLVSPGINPDDPMATACRLIRIARERGEPVQLASVAPWSSHDLQLRDWLATAGPEAMEHV